MSESLLNQARITVTGTINVSDHTVWVNGIKVTDYWSNGSGGWDWQAYDVPMTPGGTAVIEASAIPNTDNGGNGTGGSGGTVATMQAPGNPDSPEAKDTIIQPDKPWQLYMETDDIFVQDSYDYSKFDYYSPPPNSQLLHWNSSEQTKNYSHHWEYDPEAFTGSGTGTIYDLTHYEYSDYPPFTAQTDTTFYWPVEEFPGYAIGSTVCDDSPGQTNSFSMDEPALESEHCAVNDPSPTDLDYWETHMYEMIHKQEHYGYTRKAQTVWKLFTGGKAFPKRENLWVLTGWAAEVLEKRAQRPLDNEPQRAIASQAITIGELGKLGSDGLLYKVLPDQVTKNVTPKVDGVDFYTFDVLASKHDLCSYTLHPAKNNTNRSRTTVGVGEEVNIYFDPPLTMSFPETPIWLAFAGGVSPDTGSSTWFTAPSNHASTTVRVFVRDVQLDKYFNVLEPSGHGYALIIGTNSYPKNTVGAGMTNYITWFPEEVSFYRVSLMELNCDATNITGYCTNISVGGHTTGGYWFALNADNASEDKVSSTISGPAVGLYPGGWDHYIPVYWQITGSSSSNYLRNLTQSARLLNSSGDFSVSKFGLTMTRSTNDVSSSSQ